jgi:ribosomal protein S27AE
MVEQTCDRCGSDNLKPHEEYIACTACGKIQGESKQLGSSSLYVLDDNKLKEVFRKDGVQEIV